MELEGETEDDDQDMEGDEDYDMANEDLSEEDPTWSPQEIDEAYKKLSEDDDSVDTHENPR